MRYDLGATNLEQIGDLIDPMIDGDFPGGSDGNASVYNAGDPGSFPGLGRSPREGNGNTLQYCCLENPMDKGAWWARDHGVSKSRIQLSNTAAAAAYSR